MKLKTRLFINFSIFFALIFVLCLVLFVLLNEAKNETKKILVSAFQIHSSVKKAQILMNDLHTDILEISLGMRPVTETEMKNIDRMADGFYSELENINPYLSSEIDTLPVNSSQFAEYLVLSKTIFADLAESCGKSNLLLIDELERAKRKLDDELSKYFMHYDGEASKRLASIETRSSGLLIVFIFIFLIGAILYIFLGSRLSTYVVRPIQDLIEEIAQFKIDRKFLPPKSIWIARNDEIGILYNDFKGMGADLCDHFSRLQAEVEERRQLEGKLRESEEMFRALTERSPDTIMRFDRNFRHLYVNPAVVGVTGIQPEAFIGKTHQELGFPDDLCGIWEEALSRTFETGLNQHIEFILPNGVWIDWILIPEFDGNARINAVMTSARDITDRKGMESELTKTKSFLTNIFDSISSMLMVVDNNGKITVWNKSTEQYFGISSKFVYGLKIWDVVPYLGEFKNNFYNTLILQKPEMKLRKVIAGLDKKYLDISFHPLAIKGENGVVIEIENVTEIEKKNSQLIQAQKMETIGMLSGGLAHDFNNILGGIVGNISLLQEEMGHNYHRYLPKKTLGEFLDEMLESAQRASDMVQQLLSLSRKHEMTSMPMDINIALKHVVRICETTIDKSIEIKPAPWQAPAVILGDITQIEQTLLNLCINASHAMTIMRAEGQKQGGVLTLSIDRIDNNDFFADLHPEVNRNVNCYWKLNISDTGIGIDHRNLTKIFDPFFTTKEKGKGSGLGLTMVYNIVKDHKGFIDVYSEVGVGTTFSIYLPHFEKSEMPSEPKAAVRSFKPDKGLILVVDDEKVMRNCARKILEKYGYEVLLATNGEEGVNIYRERRKEIRLVLLDMIMPRKSGREAFIEMKSIDPAVNVILSSGFKRDEKIQDILDLGISEFIQKPYTIDQLMVAVAKVLKKGAPS